MPDLFDLNARPTESAGWAAPRGLETPEALDLACPMPIEDAEHITLAHGSGGKMTADLIRQIILPAFTNPLLAKLDDQAVFAVNGARLAFTTDSFVVSPIFFPGGDIGRLAVNGTINDLAMSGATPLYLSCGLILEEGLALDDLRRVVASMQAAAEEAGVSIVTGDTKVVERGHGDQLFINTSGVGLVAEGVDISASRACPGDAVLVSGWIAQHGMAIMATREGLDFDVELESDTAPLHALVAAILDVCRDVHVLRDPTRGGLASTLNEIAQSSGVAIQLEEETLPLQPEVEGLCEILGLDPLYVANEGKLIAIVPSDAAQDVLGAMRAHPLGAHAALIGEVQPEPAPTVSLRTCVGGRRIVDVPVGEQLPRIC